MYNGMISRNFSSNPKFTAIKGILTNIISIGNDGCTLLFELQQNQREQVTFLVTPKTYFINQKRACPGMEVTFFFHTFAPVPLIYPPRYKAVVGIVGKHPYFVKVDYFNNNLVSQDKSLKLNISDNTEIILENNQTFLKKPENHDLVVIYRATTRSIPAQTTPEKIIVLCDDD